jgi:hypothetical protein
VLARSSDGGDKNYIENFGGNSIWKADSLMSEKEMGG